MTAPSEERNPIKILYIAGFERSGSTIVNRVLGQIEGFIAWGELRDIWEHGKLENRSCTCGATFSTCEAWTKIYSQDFEADLGMSAADILQLKYQARAATVLRPFKKLSGSAEDLSSYRNALEKLYRSIQGHTKSKVIVDSTKASWYGHVLGQLPCIDLYTLHITRDPRGVCHSLKKRKQQGEPECQWYNPLHASLSWSLKNLGVERLLDTGPQRYLRMRYEDFMTSPETAVQSILRFINEGSSKLPFVKQSTVKMGVDHIISGSPSSRSNTGEVQLRTDEKWKREIGTVDQALITHTTLPLLLKYGYSYGV